MDDAEEVPSSMRDVHPRTVLACAVLALAAAPARAATLMHARSASAVDWVSAGVGGVSGDSAHITLSGVTGPVRQAYLYWGGLNSFDANSVYDNPTVQIDGNDVTGTSLGDTSTNCWGSGSSRVYVADVTAYVTGDAVYALSGLAQQPTYAVNGASLVVLFDDGDPANDRDLIFYEGNDSTNNQATPFLEDKGWHVPLDHVVYRGGTVNAQFHVADGQSVGGGSDSDVVLHGPTATLKLLDTASLFDGKSVPIEDVSRSPGDALWDIHTFDISPVFRAQGSYNIYIDSDPLPADCIALFALIIDLPAAPPGPPGPICGDGVLTAPEECDDGNLVDGDCCDSTCHFEAAGTVCGAAGDPCLEARCDGAGTCDADGRTCRMPVAPEAARLVLRHGRRDALVWRWWTGISTPDEFGDPLATTGYDLCLYDRGTGSLRLLMRESVAPGGTCAGTPCWTATSTTFEYRNPDGPMQQLVLHGGPSGRATVTARAAGGALTLPPMPIAPPVMVRLRGANGLCWGANFSVPERNRRGRFRSRGDFYYPAPTDP
jgi:cysteine-rich repeat protein